MRSRLPTLLASASLAAFLGPQALPAAAPPLLQPLTVRVLPGTDASVLQGLVNIRPVAKGPAVLQFDLAHKHVLDSQGQIVVDIAGNNPITLQGTVDKWRYAAGFATLSAAHPQAVRTDWGELSPRPGPVPHLYDGESITFVVDGITAGRQLLMFSIDASGTLGLLYAHDDDAVKAGDTLLIGALASAPFGVDHIIAVSTTDLARIRALAGWIAESAQAHGMLDSQGSILEQIAALRDVRVGMLSVYTCRSASNCNR